MFQKGQRVLTPFGMGTIASVQASACVVELITDGRKRIGTFVNEKLKVCSIVSRAGGQESPNTLSTPQTEETKIGELSYFPESEISTSSTTNSEEIPPCPPAPLLPCPNPQLEPVAAPKRKRGTKRSA